MSQVPAEIVTSALRLWVQGVKLRQSRCRGVGKVARPGRRARSLGAGTKPDTRTRRGPLQERHRGTDQPIGTHGRPLEHRSHGRSWCSCRCRCPARGTPVRGQVEPRGGRNRGRPWMRRQIG